MNTQAYSAVESVGLRLSGPPGVADAPVPRGWYPLGWESHWLFDARISHPLKAFPSAADGLLNPLSDATIAAETTSSEAGEETTMDEAAEELRSLQIQFRFEVDRPDPVIAYLAAHPGLSDILREAAREISRVFPSGHAIFLDVMTDPEDDDAPERLYATIGNNLSVRDSLERLDRFYDAWWLPQADHAPPTLHFSVQ